MRANLTMRDARLLFRSAIGLAAHTTLLVCFISLVLVRDAYAYLDPGTGSMLVQGVIAGLAAFFVTLRLYPQRFKAFIGRIIGRLRRKSGEPDSSDTGE
jgi:hypothetical protein